MPRARIAVVGCGYWGPNLIRNFLELEDAEVAYCCDTRQERLQFIGRRYPHLKLTDRYGDIVNDTNVDAVVIATPVFTHFELARRALEADKDVLIEKPMTASSEQAEQLLALAEAGGKVILVDHTFLYTSAVRKMKEIIERGEVGDILYFDSTRINLGLFQHDINVVWDLAPHDLSVMDYLIPARPLGVQAAGVSHAGTKLENIAYVIVYFPDELIAHVHVNWLAPVKIRLMLIGGSRKMIVYDDMQASEKVKVYDRGISVSPSNEGLHKMLVDYRVGDMYAPKLEQAEALALLARHFVDCIAGECKPISDGASGLRIVRLLEAAEKSIRSGGVRVEL